MSVQYDPSIIVEFAEQLYKQARRVIFFYSFLGFVISAFIAIVVTALASSTYVVGGLQLASVCLVIFIGTLIGSMIGRSRAFRLKLEAQIALCDVEIEKNTRKMPQ